MEERPESFDSGEMTPSSPEVLANTPLDVREDISAAHTHDEQEVEQPAQTLTEKYADLSTPFATAFIDAEKRLEERLTDQKNKEEREVGRQFGNDTYDALERLTQTEPVAEVQVEQESTLETPESTSDDLYKRIDTAQRNMEAETPEIDEAAMAEKLRGEVRAWYKERDGEVPEVFQDEAPGQQEQSQESHPTESDNDNHQEDVVTEIQGQQNEVQEDAQLPPIEFDPILSGEHSQEASPEITAEAVERIEGLGVFESFGISKEDLESIPEFTQLTDGQKLLVAENLKQVTLGRIYANAHASYKERQGEAGFFAKIGNAMTKSLQIAELQQTNAHALREGGMHMHGEVLHALINGAQDAPGIEKLPDGKAQINYIPKFEGLTPGQMEVVVAFNKAANKFGETPDAWSMDTANDFDKHKYEEAKKAYDKAKEGVVALQLEKDQANEGAAQDFLLTMDERVQMNRFFNTNQDVEKQLQKIEDENKYLLALKNSLDSKIAEGGVYLGLGYLGRSVAGVLVSPIIAASGYGALRGRLRAKDELRNRDASVREGGVDNSAEANNFITAEKLTNNLHRELQKVENANDAEKQELLSHLLTRIEYTENKITNGHVQYGSGAEKITAQYELMRILGEAQILEHETGNTQRNAELDARIEGLLGRKQENIDEARRAYVKKKTRQGAIFGGSFALAGELLAEARANDWWGGGEDTLPSRKAVTDSTTESVVSEISTEEALSGVSVLEDLQHAELSSETFSEAVHAMNIPRPLGDPYYRVDHIAGIPVRINGVDIQPELLSEESQSILARAQELGVTEQQKFMTGHSLQGVTEESMNEVVEETPTRSEEVVPKQPTQNQFQEDVRIRTEQIIEDGGDPRTASTIAYNEVQNSAPQPLAETPQYGTETPAAPLGERAFTTQELQAARQTYAGEQSRDIQSIFAASLEEKQAQAQQNIAQKQLGDQARQAIQNNLPQEARGFFSQVMQQVPNNEMQLQQNIYANRMVEWEGIPSRHIPGIRDLQVTEVLNEHFKEGGKDFIAKNNRGQIADYVRHHLSFTKPLQGETTEQFLLRAKAIRDTGR